MASLKASRSADKFIICYTEFSSVGGFMLKKRKLSMQAGFSLVELMIVVAIIGVLTAIAIPNFQAFQRRSRQSEAKSALTALYTAEQTFHSSWEVYTGSLQPAGWTPSGDYRYQIGFNDGTEGFCGMATNPIVAGTPPTTIMCGPAPGRVYTGENSNWQLVNLTEFCGGSDGTEANGVRCNFSAMVGANITAGDIGDHDSDPSTPDQLIPADNTMGEVTAAVLVNSFTAGAVGDLIGENNGMQFDVWQINQEKELDHRHNGANF